MAESRYKKNPNFADVLRSQDLDSITNHSKKAISNALKWIEDQKKLEFDDYAKNILLGASARGNQAFTALNPLSTQKDLDRIKREQAWVDQNAGAGIGTMVMDSLMTLPSGGLASLPARALATGLIEGLTTTGSLPDRIKTTGYSTLTSGLSDKVSDALGLITKPFKNRMGMIETYHGSLHKFPPVNHIEMPDGTRLYQNLLENPDLPQGAKVIEHFPAGRFDMSKIGTGEGAQAYGHGLYFAESPEVAKGYKNRLSGGASTYFYDWNGKTYEGGVKGDPIAHAIGLTYHQGKKDAVKIAQMGLDDAKRGEAYAIEQGGVDYYKKMLETAKTINKKDIKASQGNLYKTSLEWPDPAREASDPLGPHHFLDWDKPLSEQPQSIRDIIPGKDSQNPVKAIHQAFSNGDRWAMNWAKEQGLDPYSADFGAMQADQLASMYLNSKGIPGIRYLDQGSRGAGEGSYNYVVFDDRIPKIVERNGQPVMSQALKTAPVDDNLNSSLLAKYLREGQLTPDELTQYEANAVKMSENPNTHHYNLANANAQGGTPESRAADLGFDTDLYHGRYKDYPAVKDGRTFYATNDPDYASIYAFEPTASSMGGKSVSDFQDLQPNVLPVKVRSNDFVDTRTKQGRKVFENDFFMKYGNGTPLTEKGLPDWVDAEDFGEMFADTKSKFKGVLADEGAIPTWDGGTKDRGVSHAVFDPRVIRSRFAAFDPLRKNSSDLLAGGLLPAPLAAYLLMNYPEEEY